MAVTLQTLNDGPRNHVVHMGVALANAAAVVVDVSAMAAGGGAISPTTEVKVVKVDWSLTGGGATLLWDATANVKFMELAAGEGDHDYRKVGGLINNAGAGKTGDILLTNAAGLTDGQITLWCVKR